MKKIMFALLLVALATVSAFAQAPTKILEPTDVSGLWATAVNYEAGTGMVAPLADNPSFNETTLTVDCKGIASPSASLAGDANGGGIIVDNLIEINGQWQGPNGLSWCDVNGNYPDGSCFSSYTGVAGYSDPVPVPPIAAINTYQPTNGAVDIHSALVGKAVQPLTIRLLNAGNIYANGPIYLTTNCQITKQTICHKDDSTGPVGADGLGTGESLFISVNAVSAHIGHHAGDYYGACR